jgi:superfamily I DNA and RNA helicase
MGEMAHEVQAVRQNDFHLIFPIPTSEQLAEIRRLHRERTDEEVASMRRASRNAEELVAALERGEIDIDELPANVRTRLVRLIRQDINDNGED